MIRINLFAYCQNVGIYEFRAGKFIPKIQITQYFVCTQISPRATVHNSHYKFIYMKYEVDILHIVHFEQEFIIAIFHDADGGRNARRYSRLG